MQPPDLDWAPFDLESKSMLKEVRDRKDVWSLNALQRPVRVPVMYPVSLSEQCRADDASWTF